MEIPDDAVLLRHVHVDQWLRNEQRASSAAFKDRRLSVNLKALRGVDETRRESSGAIVSLVAGECRKLGQEVEHAPIPENEPFGPNPAHTEIVGDKPRPIARLLANLAHVEWVRPDLASPAA